MVNKKKQRKLQRIKKTMETMKSGYYFDVHLQFSEITWVIWLENFKKDSNVHIINEWLHWFHSNWLFEWYENIDFNKDLRWPHWKHISSYLNNFKEHQNNEDGKFQLSSGKFIETNSHIGPILMLSNQFQVPELSCDPK